MSLIALLWTSGLAWGQVAEYATEDCTPNVIPGTVAYNVGRQSIDTNAQVYSAESLVRDVIGRGGVFGLRLNNVYGVTSVPTLATCGNGQQLGLLDLDLFSSATAVGFNIPLGSYEMKLFYAGSVTGSHLLYPDEGSATSRYYTYWGYAGLGYAAAFLAPLAPLISRDDGLQTMAGDFIAGTSLSVPGDPDLGTLDAGYVYYSGLYTNISSRRLMLFATTMLTDRFALLALARAGLEGLPVAGRQNQDKTGTTSFFAQNRVLKSPTSAGDGSQGFQGLLSDKQGALDLSTIHFEQRRIGEYVTVSAALAIRPSIFLHEGSVGIDIPYSAIGWPAEDEGSSFLHGVVGVSEMPALPWYGEEGGRQLFVDLTFMDVLSIRRNAPSTLSIFPYAQGAWEFSIQFEVIPPPKEDEG